MALQSSPTGLLPAPAAPIGPADAALPSRPRVVRVDRSPNRAHLIVFATIKVVESSRDRT